MTTKNALLLGATGPTGRLILTRLLAGGFKVTVLVRDPSRLGNAASGARVLVGNVLDAGPTIDNAVAGQDVVISSLGVGSSLKPNGLIAKGLPAVVRSMEALAVRRLVAVSAFGVGDTWSEVPALPRVLIRLFLRNIYADKQVGEDSVHRSSLDWTIVYPVTLTNGPLTGKYRFGEHLDLRGLPRISRADVADFIVSHIDDSVCLHRGLVIAPLAVTPTPSP